MGHTGDVHKASANVKSHLPGSSPNAEGQLKGYGAQAGEKIDKAVRLSLSPLFRHLSTPTLP